MTVKRVIFIRPGETDWNRLGRWQGWAAVPLNERGKRQARQLANFIRNIGMSALYTSDLKRAIETANILAERLGFVPVLDSRLRERNIGAWQGLTRDEMCAWYPDEYTRLLEDPVNFKVPSGESRREVLERALQAFNGILAQDMGETVGILSHTTTIHVLLREIVADQYTAEVPVSNSSVTTITRNDDGKWKLVTADDVMHLEGLETQRYPELEDTQ
jgi:broad specificity phosphatase PhoE